MNLGVHAKLMFYLILPKQVERLSSNTYYQVLKIYTQGAGKNKPTKNPPRQHNS